MVAVQQIMVVTSSSDFGDLIYRSLEETGAYRVFLVNSSQEALTCAQNEQLSLAILDSDLGGEAFPTLAQSLKAIQEKLHLVIIPPDNNPQHPMLRQIPFDGYFTKPFYLPDLLDTVAEVLSANDKSQATPIVTSSHLSSGSYLKDEDASLEWLKDVNSAAQHLTRLSLETSAQAALIVRQGELWAYAGHLEQPAAQELAVSVALFWIDSRQSVGDKPSHTVDLVRMLRLITTGKDYLLYVTPLGFEMVLALAFDETTPFSIIRAQANYLARCLASPEDEIQLIKPPQAEARKTTRPPLRSVPSSPATKINLPEGEDIDLDEDDREINHKPLLDDVPQPDPKKTPARRDIREQDLVSTPQSSVLGPSVLSKPNGKIDSEFSIFTSQESLNQSVDDESAFPLPPEQEDTTQIEQAIWTEELATTVQDGVLVKQELRPITPSLHGLYYVCLMIPRSPKQHLTGDLAGALADMIPQLCLAYGWRLEHISIRPEYLQWISSVPPATSPSNLVRVFRQQTSLRIFDAFPSLKREIPSGDFWAPGYLIISGSKPPSAQTVKEYIHQTRQHQGADRPSRLKA